MEGKEKKFQLCDGERTCTQKQSIPFAVVPRAKLMRSAESPGASWVLMQSYLPFLKITKKNTKVTWVQEDKASASVSLR